MWPQSGYLHQMDTICVIPNFKSCKLIIRFRCNIYNQFIYNHTYTAFSFGSSQTILYLANQLVHSSLLILQNISITLDSTQHLTSAQRINDYYCACIHDTFKTSHQTKIISLYTSNLHSQSYNT